MTEDPILQQLQRSADLALKSSSIQEGVEHLKQAFHLFSKETQRLQVAYLNLQEQLETVNRELSVKASHLQRANRYLENILTRITDGIVFIDLKGVITLMKKRAEELLEISSEKVLFQKFVENFEDRLFGFSMKEALMLGTSYKLLYQKDWEISTTFVYEGPKVEHGMIVIFRDTKEKQKLQLLASRSDRMKELGQMAATVAHEIRNPLGGIRGYASLLERDLEDQPHLREMAHFILEGTKSLDKIVSSILHYAKPIEVELQTLDLGAFLKKVARFFRIDPAFPTNVQFLMHIPQDPILVPFDPEALKAALLNLFFNALQAMESGGKLSLSLLKLDASVQIAISDTGVGMDEEQLDHLFSAFYTTKKGGNGLGLVETQKIVKAHFGSIEVRSKPQKGSTFTLTLPLKR